MDETWVGFWGGVMVALCLSVFIGWLTIPNISDAELYRFCMKNGIALEACKITKNKEQPHDK